MLTRREFLGASILGGLGLTLFPNLKIEKLWYAPAKFEYIHEYGNVITWSGRFYGTENKTESQIRDWVINELKKDARKCIPLDCPFEIRQAVPSDYGRESGIAWYYSPDFVYDRVDGKIVEKPDRDFGRTSFFVHRNITGRRKEAWIEEKVEKMSDCGAYWLVERCISR